METLRLAQSEYLYRLTTTDIRYKDFLFPRGWLVRICVGESHRDPIVFSEPSVFNPDRFLDPKITRHQFSPFGAGLRHSCLGEELTILIGRVLVKELVRGADWRTVADGPYEYSSWRHWRPASAWRVSVTPVSELIP